jgi:hypothetical protein
MISSASLLAAQTTAPAVTDLAKLSAAKLSIAKMLQQMQTPTLQGDGDAPSPLQIVVQFLQLRPDQQQELGQLLVARQTAATPLLVTIQQKSQQLEKLLNSGGNPPGVGVLVIQIHSLQTQVAKVQQSFLTQFVSLLDTDQQQLLQAVGIAAQLQPVLPAFEDLSLF